MKPAAQVKCPNCQNILRVPPDMVDISVKCKHCGYILQLRKRSAPAAAAPAVPAPAPAWPPAAPALRTPSANGHRPKPQPLGELPEYTPAVAAVPRAASAPRSAAMTNSAPEANASDYNPAFERSGRRHSGRGSYKGPRGKSDVTKWIVVGSILMLGATVLAMVVFKPDWFSATPTVATNPDGKNDRVVGPAAKDKGAGADSRGTQPPAEYVTAPMPRRLLAIGVSNYLYANPVLYGSRGFAVERDRDRHDFYKAIERLADGWRIPKTQRYYIADGPIDEGKIDFRHPPLKMVIEGTIDSFLKTCRPQDRIVIVFAGHAMEKDGEAYLLPLEGEFEDIPSLIPLKDLYAKLGKCPAQEKLVIFDVCRSFPGRGIDRPVFGAMTEALEKALHNCPDGVAVWTSCSAGQFSYEDEYAQIDLVGLGKPTIQGSYFLSVFFPAAQKEIFSKREHGPGFQHPADPLPIGPVTQFIDEKTAAVAKELQPKGTPQIPKLTSKERKQWLPYDPNAALAVKFEITKPPPTAKREEVVGMFKELDLPPIKALLVQTNSETPVDSFPFTEAQLKDYLSAAGPTFDEIAKAPEKFAKEFPIRVATVNAIIEMRKLKNDGSDLPEEFNSPITDATKKSITDKIQRSVGERGAVLGELKDNLEEVAKKRDAEKSKRWLADFDFAYAQVRARLAYISEYNLALGNVKTDKLPELDQKIHRGWKLSSVSKMTSPKEIRDLADDAKSAFADIATNNPNTPWGVMSKAQKNMTFGLKWEPLLKANAETEPEAKSK